MHYLQRYVVGKTIDVVKTQEDDVRLFTLKQSFTPTHITQIVYGKVGTSASAFKKAMTGKKVVDARQQGKYFWLVMESAPHPLMHFGMAGWM